MVHSRKPREGKTKDDWIPARNKGDWYFSIKREVAGKLRVGMYQNREGGKGNESEGKKERRGTFPAKTRGKDHSMALAIWFISISKKELEKCRKTSEQTRLPTRISHTLVFLLARQALLVLTLIE